MVAALVAVAAFISFLPALSAQFVNWDDPLMFLTNPAYRGLDPNRIIWMFTSSHMGHYTPLTWVTHALDYMFWRMNPLGYHLTNNLFHAANAALVFLVAQQLLAAALCNARKAGGASILLGSSVAALLFAVHPLRVESVAWVTERRDVVSLFFLLLSALSYLRYCHGGEARRKAYMMCLAWLACSLLSKGWAITFPIVLIAIDVYPLRRMKLGNWNTGGGSPWPLLLEKLPHLFLVAAGAASALWAQITAGMEDYTQYSLPNRLAQACYGLVFYIYKTLLPLQLCPIYEIPQNMSPFEPRFITSAAIVVAAAALLFALRKKFPATAACGFTYLVIVSPVLGLAQSGRQLVADRYSYVACIPWTILAGGGFSLLWSRLGQRGSSARRLAIIVCGAVLLALSGMTWRQCGVWRDSWSLWTHCISIYPNSWNALNNLGTLYAEKKDFQQALTYYRRATDVNPRHATLWSNAGRAAAKLGQRADALRYLHEAVKCDPDDPVELTLLLVGLTEVGAHEDALPFHARNVLANPADDMARYAYATALEECGKDAEAIEQLKKGIEIAAPRVNINRMSSPSHESDYMRYQAALSRVADLLERSGFKNEARAYREKIR